MTSAQFIFLIVSLIVCLVVFFWLLRGEGGFTRSRFENEDQEKSPSETNPISNVDDHFSRSIYEKAGKDER